jgi:hypothetical protein
MEDQGTITLDRAVLVWLRSEGDRLSLPQGEYERLIKHPDLGNAADNNRRLELLRVDLNRRQIIDRSIPPGASIKWVYIEEQDLPKLYIIPTYHWYLNTGRSFLLTYTEANLKPGRSANVGHDIEAINTYDTVTALEQRFASYDAASTGEALIIIAPSDDGPYTIIDGNHRAAALYRNYLRAPNTPWKGILITHPAIADSLWYINSQTARANIRNTGILADRGLLL